MIAFMGIDPGREGAWALVDRDGRGLWVEDLPYVSNRLDTHALLRTWRLQMGSELSDVRAAIEHPLAYVNQSPTFNLTSGINYGQLVGALAVCGIAFEEVMPAAWKSKVGLNADKEKSRLKAIQAYPHFARELQFKKNDGRAEALWLGEFERRKTLRIRVPREGD